MDDRFEIEALGTDRAPGVAALVTAALPDEELSLDELLAVCWEDPDPDAADRGVVLGSADGLGAVAVVWRAPADDNRLVADRQGSPAAGEAFVKLVAVHPEARRQGRGHALLAAAERWAWDRGAESLHLAGAPPFYLWPGVDALATPMLCLAEARGYEPVGSGLNMVLPTTFRAPAPDAIAVRRVVTDDDVARLVRLLDGHWPEWTAETLRAVEHGCCHAAFAETDRSVGIVDDGEGADGEVAVGFACHSVSRAGWLGPMGTDPGRRAEGVGQALLGRVCRDLMIAEMDHTEICWAGPVRFYAKSGATVSRVFRQYRLSRPTTL